MISFKESFAYVIGALFLLFAGIVVFHGFAVGHVFRTHPALAQIPTSRATVGGPLFFLAITLTGAIGGFAWPSLFNKIYTADSVRSIKKSAAIFTPISAVFFTLLILVAMMAGGLPGAHSDPQNMYFTVSKLAGGYFGLGLAGIIVLSVAMGSVDSNIQANGIQVARDIFAVINPQIKEERLVWISKTAMWVLIGIAVIIANLKLPALIIIAIVAYQGIVQLVPTQLLGLFWRRGTRAAAIASMSVGFLTAIIFQVLYPTSIPWLGGLTSGILGLAVNTIVYVVLSLSFPNSAKEQERVDQLFETFRGDGAYDTTVQAQ